MASGERAAELGLRFTYAGFPRERLEIEPDLERALERGLELTAPGAELAVLPTYTAMLRAPCDRDRARPHAAVLGELMEIRVAHLYPEYLNIYADRGNIAVFERRAARGAISSSSPRSRSARRRSTGAHDLLYVGGGQDREQAMIAPDLAERGEAIREAVDGGAALLAVCGGYQLLGRGYRGRDGSWMPGARSSRTRRSPASSG